MSFIAAGKMPRRLGARQVNRAEMLEPRRLLSGTLHPLTAIPVLNSDPAARVQLYLDFHGEPATRWGGYNASASPAYDIDGDPTTFSDAELANIQQIWARVAEKYSPFNINLTTVDPGPPTYFQNLKVVVGGTSSWLGTAEGGVSYVGSFSSSYLPDSAYVFSSNLANGDPRDVAEAICHEGGHAFGLYHQSVYSGTTKVAEYNPGNSLVAPVMGSSINSQRGVWWYGTSAISSTTIQDDMAIIAGATNGFGYRPQDHGQSIAAADSLTASGSSVSGSGIVESTTDADYYRFTTAAGTVTLNVNVAQYGPMLHAKAQLFDSSGNLIATAADPNTLAQSISTALPAGTYYLAVQSFGQYGDVGRYTVNGTVAVAPSHVVGRSVFYNNSAFDNNDPSAGPADDGAIATDKQALLPDQSANFANYTSYNKGLNGIMIDVAGLPAGVTLSASDFAFHAGSNSNSAAWSIAPAPSSITLRPGEGTGGSDRVELIWPDHNPLAASPAAQAVAGEWLQVTVLADANTALASPDVFYFGNAIGDSGNSPTDAAVTINDVLAARGRISATAAAITCPWDYNRDGIISNDDVLVARANQTAGDASLQLITAPATVAAPTTVATSPVVSASTPTTVTTTEPIASGPTQLTATTISPMPTPSSGAGKPSMRSPRPRTTHRHHGAVVKPVPKKLTRQAIILSGIFLDF